MRQSELELAENEEGRGTARRARIEALSFPSVLLASLWKRLGSFFSKSSDRLLHSLDYIAILRPLLLIPVWTMLLLGYYKGLGGGFSIVWHPDNEILITLFLYSLLMGAVYILNQINDSHTDEINGKLYLVAQGYMKENSLRIQIGILLSLPVIIAILGFPRVYVSLILLSIVLGVLYSVPPVRLKGRPILDLFANASGFGFVAFAVGWTSKSVLSKELILDCLPYVICVSAAFINTTIPDIRGDVQNGDITTGAFLGIRNSCIVSTLLVGTVPLISLLLRDFICLTASALSLPFYLRMTVLNWSQGGRSGGQNPEDKQPPEISAVTLATKVSLLILSLLTAVFIPIYFVLLIPTLLLVKAYYQMRFGIRYP